MKILLTNDDGIAAHGLHALAITLAKDSSLDIGVVAPASERTAASRSFTLGLLSVADVTDQYQHEGISWLAVDGTPVDCVRLAAVGILGFVPDLVVSGINHGVNLGDDVAHSGTAAAAFEAATLGAPGIAISKQSAAYELDFRSNNDWELNDFLGAAEFIHTLIDGLKADPLPKRTLLNINWPGSDSPKDVSVCRLGRRTYRGQLQQVGTDAGSLAYFVSGELGYEHGRNDDFSALQRGDVAITPIRVDGTDDSLLTDLPGLRLRDALQHRSSGPSASQ
jgi:5'-nucleotidase